mgnify:CR=1 FL=1
MQHLWTMAGIAATAFVVGLSGALMPGPLLAVTVEESARRGAAAGPLIVLGHMLLEAVLVGALAAGLGSLLARPTVIAGIGLLGGAAMCWMGAAMLRSLRRLSWTSPTAAGPRLHPVAAGIVVSLSNPYWTLWWVTVGAGYVVLGLRFGWPGLAAFFLGHILADFAWYTLVSAGVARGRRLFGDRCYRGLVGLCGALMLVFGVGFVRSGAATLGSRGSDAAAVVPSP